MLDKLHIASYYIYKGFSCFNWHCIAYKLHTRLQKINIGIFFLQKVTDRHSKYVNYFNNLSSKAQHKLLAGSVWMDFTQVKYLVYDAYLHGNAVQSRYPSVSRENKNISAYCLENRTLLHCKICAPGWRENLSCISVRLGLFKTGKKLQLQALKQYFGKTLPLQAQLVIAGNLNVWHEKASYILTDEFDLTEVFEFTSSRTIRSFPSSQSLLQLDRIYIRNFDVKNVNQDAPWSRASDHTAPSANLLCA